MHGGRGNVPIGYPIFHHLEIKDAISIELVEIENKIAQE
jgi:hypothetical protein